MRGIRILPCGTVTQDHIHVAQMSFNCSFPQELYGDWVFEEDVECSAASFGDELEDAEAEREEAERERDNAIEAQEAAEAALKALQDEVRAFVVCGSTCSVAVARLKEALEASE